MTTAAAPKLTELYLDDETAWLEHMAELARQRDVASLDWTNLSEYLTDMAHRDRREVKNRLRVLLAHLLKWEHQPDKRTGSWRATILEQREQLVDLASRGVLRAHAEVVLEDAYGSAIELASAETGLPASAFPESCPYDLDFLFALELND
jgi:hypothetical protein